MKTNINIYIITSEHLKARFNHLNHQIVKFKEIFNKADFIYNFIQINNPSHKDIEKTLDNFRNSGRIQELPPFPDIKDDVKFKIALFHGTFTGSKLYNGETINQNNNPYPLEWVENFDFVLLGDIHKRQIFTYKNKTHCGYSGSLIQQNFGEDIIKHGFLIWDLFNKQVQEINVYNEIGYINIKENDNQDILIRFNGKYDTLLEDVITNPLFPKKLEIKIFSKINFQKLNHLLNKYNILYNIISRFDEKPLLINLDVREDENCYPMVAPGKSNSQM